MKTKARPKICDDCGCKTPRESDTSCYCPCHGIKETHDLNLCCLAPPHVCKRCKDHFDRCNRYLITQTRSIVISALDETEAETESELIPIDQWEVDSFDVEKIEEGKQDDN